MTRDERILEDLNQHVRTKIVRCMADHFSTCDAADLDLPEVLRDMMVMLISLTTSFAASQFNLTVEDFAKAMAVSFMRAQKKEREDEAASVR